MDLLPIDLPLPSQISLTPRPEIPFSIYLKQAATSKHKQALFQPYTRLPVELQLKILESCDAPTTFRLMQTSSGIRKTATKLFWSHEDPWYYILSTDIDVTEERAPDSVSWDSQFVKHIEQVEIGFKIESAPPTHAFPRNTLGGSVLTPWADNADQFRAVFQRGFPSAKRVIISLRDARWMHPPTQIPRALCTIARAFTPHYTVFIALPSRPSLMMDFDAESLETNQCPATERKYYQHFLEEAAAMEYLRHELYEKYHFGGPEQIPFACPRNDCDIEFKTAAEWRDHMNTYQYQDHDRLVEIGKDGRLDYTSRLPAEIEDTLIAKELEIDEAMKRSVCEKIQLVELYGEKGSEQRRLYEEQFLDQLKHDPACKSQDDLKGSVLFRRLQWEWDRYDETGVKRGDRSSAG
ncbi:hypothetical protein EJ08DRAFT_735867 [Tothia fuscella]|uniref:F-box domain-containing protein n=1 Tax=Tothia fuscella TaxID=1048955 RepID=A0A9P4NNB2_9PEZI|nr:hypothetical protein EJ08DRAFT_735867 [Tothia fuscella]